MPCWITEMNPAGSEDPADLVINGILTERKLVAIAPFLVISDDDRTALEVKGRVRFDTRWAAGDEGIPPLGLRTRLETLRNLTLGFAGVLTRNRVDDVVYDAARDALNAQGQRERMEIPKFYAKWETDDFGIVAGTYRIGFGQRLTFDNTDQIAPNGFYADDELLYSRRLSVSCKESAGELSEPACSPDDDTYISPDFSWRERLLGVAAGAKQIQVGSGVVQTHGFFSYQPKSIYQYELYRPDQCTDPTNDDDPACSAPEVFRRQRDPLTRTSRFSFQTLPDVYAEMVGGGNITYRFDRRAHVGVTGYRADVRWLLEGLELDFQEWSRTPFGGPYGAIGADAGYGVGNTDIFAEVARSFDSMPTTAAVGPGGGGGMGAVARTVTTWGKNELETSIRYYDKKFANPHARPIAAPDEFDGLRARDETGAGVIAYRTRIRRRMRCGDLRFQSRRIEFPNRQIFRVGIAVPLQCVFARNSTAGPDRLERRFVRFDDAGLGTKFGGHIGQYDPLPHGHRAHGVAAVFDNVARIVDPEFPAQKQHDVFRRPRPARTILTSSPESVAGTGIQISPVTTTPVISMAPKPAI